MLYQYSFVPDDEWDDDNDTDTDDEEEGDDEEEKADIGGMDFGDENEDE